VEAAEAVGRQLHRLFGLAGIGYIQAAAYGFSARMLDVPDRLFGIIFIDIGNAHRGALGGKPPGDRAANGASGAGNQRRFSFEPKISHHSLLKRILAGMRRFRPTALWLSRSARRASQRKSRGPLAAYAEKMAPAGNIFRTLLQNVVGGSGSGLLGFGLKTAADKIPSASDIPLTGFYA